MNSDTGFIEDLLNEEDQDIFAESPRGVDAPLTKLSKADPARERRKDAFAEGHTLSGHEPTRSTKVEYKSQQQSQKQQKSFPPRHNRRARSKYFIIRSGNMENVSISYEHGAWATQARNEPKLVEAFQSAENVYLIFSVNQSGHFQGYGRMTTLPGKLGRNVSWAGGFVGNCFGVEWECWSELPYEQTLDLRNPWNENKPVKISRDGQELPADIGDELLSRMQGCGKQKGGARQQRSAPSGKLAGGRPGFLSNNRGLRPGNFEGFMDRSMGPGMMDAFEMGMEGPMGHMGPIAPGMGPMGMGPGIGPLGMRPMMHGVMPGDGPMMDMLGGGMGMGPIMDGPMRSGMMMDAISMRRNMGMNTMGMHGPPSGGPPRNLSPAHYNQPDSGMGGNAHMHINGGAYAMPHRLGAPSHLANLGDSSRHDHSVSPVRERGRSPSRKQSGSQSRGRVHSRSRSRSHSRGQKPNLMDMSYDEYLEHYKKVQRRMREMQEMKMTSQGNAGGSSNSMGSNMFGGMMGMTGMNPMMSGMSQMMGAGMMPNNLGMMYNNMGGMMNRSGIMSESEYVEHCQRYFAAHGRACPPDDKLRKYYRDMKAQWERMKQQGA